MPLEKRIGLIAGNGIFPLTFAKAARLKGYRIFAICVKKDTTRGLKAFVDRLIWLEVGEFRKMVEFFKAASIQEAVMAGQITPRRLFDKRVKWDKEFCDLLANIENKKADTIFSSIADLLENQSIKLIDSTSFLSERELPKAGVLTLRKPQDRETADIIFGVDLARKIADLDIGQTIVIKNKCIVAVEAFEGTNSAISRAGRLVGKGAVVVKVSRPKQDKRFDVPVIGPKTILVMKRAGLSAIGIEAGKTLVLEGEKTIQLANKFNIAIVCF